MNRIDPLAAATACALALLCTPAWAGRPLSVDDANVDDKGTGHVEAWFARGAGSTNGFTQGRSACTPRPLNVTMMRREISEGRVDIQDAGIQRLGFQCQVARLHKLLLFGSPD